VLRPDAPEVSVPPPESRFGPGVSTVASVASSQRARGGAGVLRRQSPPEQMLRRRPKYLGQREEQSKQNQNERRRLRGPGDSNRAHWLAGVFPGADGHRFAHELLVRVPTYRLRPG